MALYRKPQDLIRAQEDRLRRVLKASGEAGEKTARMVQAEAIALTSGPAAPPRTSGKGRGFRARRGLPIGRKSGELSRSFRIIKVRPGLYRVVNVASHAPHVLTGSGKRDRGFWRELKRRIVEKARAIHIKELKRAVKGNGT